MLVCLEMQRKMLLFPLSALCDCMEYAAVQGTVKVTT